MALYVKSTFPHFNLLIKSFPPVTSSIYRELLLLTDFRTLSD